MTPTISPDQWTVSGYDANHRQFWRTVVRASSLDNAVRVAWSHLARPAWVSVHTLQAELRTVANDPVLQELIRDGFVREVTQ